ncbi:MAG: response regulator [Paludibacteraceae bacterium]|nr:response regulator [Paludibacteraceae bacterium]
MKRFSIWCVLVWVGVLTASAHDHYTIQHYSIKDGMSQNTVMAILQDRQGFMWFGTWDGLNRFDGYRFEIFKAMDKGVEAHVNNRVDVIYEDEAEQLWWMTYDGHFYCMDKSRKVTMEMQYDDLPEGFLRKLEENELRTKVDQHGVIWQADDEQGIMRYRFGQWKRFTPPLDSRYAGRLREHFFILEDNRGRTWVNPTGGGWSYYDYEKDELVNPLSDITNMIHTAYIDRDGLMWISTYDGGVDCINMEPTPYKLIDMRRSNKENGEVRAFAKSRDGEVTPLVKSQTNVYAAKETRHGMLYGAKGKGLYNASTGQIIATSHPDIYDIEETADGVLCVATYGGGVNILHWDARNNKWSAPEVLGTGLKVRDIEIVDNTLWCGTTTGVLRVNLDTKEVKVIPSYDIRALYYSHSKLWLGTFGGGLNVLDPSAPDPEIQHIETFHDIILSMAGDGKNLWFTSESDIAQLDLETGDLYYYDALDGQRNTYFTEAEAARTRQGTILFGYNEGYCAFDPSRVIRTTSTPPMRITRIASQDEDLYGDTVCINNDASITIEYAAMEYVDAAKIVYSYKMDGIDKDWNHAMHVRRVTYSHLPYGKYIFHVRSTNREGMDADNERLLYIIVNRPLWLSWWAMTLYALGILLLIALAIYIITTYNQLRQKVQVEKQVTDIKLRFFTNISHELRTPLTLIIAPVENILQNERISQSVRNQLEIVKGNSLRMLRMVNQLLEFRKIQNQKKRLKVQQTLLSELVKETCANFQKEADDKHIRFSIENRASDTTVWVDRACIDTIVWNLLSNAFKFTPAGKAIRVIIDSKPDFVILAVQDEGIGIPMENRSVLFERFSNNNELGSPEKGGTGIGLNLVKELVDLHHGHIDVESEIGKGTTFTILLHTGKDHFDSNVEFIADDQSTTGTETAPMTLEDKLQQLEQEADNRHTILVVDDNKDMRQFLVNILGRDYNVKTAEDGEEAKQIIRTTQLDLIITDLMMPHVDGLELTKYVKTNPDLDYIPVVLLTAKTAIESRLESMQIGADDYITKPFEPEYLRARVHNIISLREQMEQSYRQRLMRLEPQKGDEQVPGDTFLAKLLDIMDKQMDNNTLTVEELVEEMGMGRTVFFNKLKSMTGLSPVEFIREMRIKRAAQLLEERQYNITEVTYMVGMNDSRYFAKCFKNTYGLTPSEYRRRCLQTEEKKSK